MSRILKRQKDEIVRATLKKVASTAGGSGVPQSVPAVTGSRGGNAALASLLSTLATQGYIVDSTTA